MEAMETMLSLGHLWPPFHRAPSLQDSSTICTMLVSAERDVTSD